ncbi:MAG: beta-N-acetylglucosaminidase domain-containing protein [Alloprevotella sp.]|nr:beta-N-acetylglucosaminidase domain-containing protein [Alloprevotella sp.]
MKSKSFLLSLLMALLPLALSAQQVTISPIPQSIEWGTKAFAQGAGGNCTLHGADLADADAVRALNALLAQTTFDTDLHIYIGERGAEAVAAYAAQIPEKAEGYYLSVQPGTIVIAGNDGRGTFYAVQSLKQILAQPEVHSVTIQDWPDILERGVVEGFYGNNWSQTDRIRQFEFYGANKMNVYIYGPKDDPYHRNNWRQNYPTAEANKMKELVQKANENKVKFVWAIHPGLDIKWNKTDSMNVVKKLEAMYELGVRSFAVFFDDIFGEGTSGIKQAQLLNYVTDEFVKKHDDVDPLIMCPTEYNRSWSSDNSQYLRDLKNTLYPEVRVMWTGNSVVDFINKSDVTWINQRIGRKAYIWLNYPVTDYCIRHLLMGPTFGDDLTIANDLSGYTSNPMEYAEASMLSLYSIADYTWHMKTYDSNASWERAIKYLMPRNHEAFHVFCEHNVDLGQNTHGLRRTNESVAFKAVADDFKQKMTAAYDTAALQALLGQFDLMVNAADTLLATDESPELIAEITPWLQVMKLMGQRGQLIVSLYEDLHAENPEAFIEHYLAFTENEAAQKNVLSRDFPGSIKVVNPVVADVVVGPFLKEQLGLLVTEYRSKYDYRLDVFPAQVVDDGEYYIKYNGKYLTNVSATSSYPTFKADEDLVNPTRQYWTITLDMATNRYKIVSSHDNRYVNEKGAFTTNNTTNPYESAWHSYNIYRLNGKYAIQNAGSAGDKYWKASTTRLQAGTSNQWSTDNYILEIIPVGKTMEHPTIEAGKEYAIIDSRGYLLTNTLGSVPQFQALKPGANKLQAWKFSIDTAKKRYKLVNAKDNRYVNEKGEFGSNAFYNDWNTYCLYEMGGLFAIQNAESAGTQFWGIDGNRITKQDKTMAESFLFTIIPFDVATGISAPTTDSQGITLSQENATLRVHTNAIVLRITLTTMDGKQVRQTANNSALSLSGLPAAPYVVTIQTSKGLFTEKVLVK